MDDVLVNYDAGCDVMVPCMLAGMEWSSDLLELCSSATFGKFQYIQKLPTLATPANFGNSRNCQLWQLPELPKLATPSNLTRHKKDQLDVKDLN